MGPQKSHVAWGNACPWLEGDRPGGWRGWSGQLFCCAIRPRPLLEREARSVTCVASVPCPTVPTLSVSLHLSLYDRASTTTCVFRCFCIRLLDFRSLFRTGDYVVQFHSTCTYYRSLFFLCCSFDFRPFLIHRVIFSIDVTTVPWI